MHKHILIGLLCGAALCAGARAQEEVTPAATARQQQQEIAHGDPHRWYVADNTSASQIANLRKEINAALQEQLTACRQQHSGRAGCERDARVNYQQDMARIRQIRKDNNQLE